MPASERSAMQAIDEVLDATGASPGQTHHHKGRPQPLPGFALELPNRGGGITYAAARETAARRSLPGCRPEIPGRVGQATCAGRRRAAATDSLPAPPATAEEMTHALLSERRRRARRCQTHCWKWASPTSSLTLPVLANGAGRRAPVPHVALDSGSYRHLENREELRPIATPSA